VSFDTVPHSHGVVLRDDSLLRRNWQSADESLAADLLDSVWSRFAIDDHDDRDCISALSDDGEGGDEVFETAFVALFAERDWRILL
jgi:hypothetical protein